jgi:phosphonoacetaldehyde hydrolase
MTRRAIQAVVFAEAGIEISEAEARADMGRAKRDHVRALLAMPRIAGLWNERHGSPSTEDDVTRLHDAVEPKMRAAARDCARLIPGAVEIASDLRGRGVKIGSTTGYTRPMMADILPLAAEQGYAPDVVVCAGETAQGRPSPLMMWKALVELGAWPCCPPPSASRGSRRRRRRCATPVRTMWSRAWPISGACWRISKRGSDGARNPGS